ncbi:MAG: ArnT family glycosyltransferase, partial [Patescibacteria group bacterium]
MKKYLILVLVLIFAFVLRFYRLDLYPAVNADEAAIGYNAYSLIQTGADEHGNLWPVHFQSFNDYKPGLYFYMVLPFVRLLGLNEWAVRIPGAALGVGTVLVVYFLVIELGRLGGLGKLGKYNQVFALTSAFFLAISPWHIHFSRGGWEVNAATFFITTGVWLFLKYINRVFSPSVGKSDIKYLVLSIVFFTASLYTYHAARIIVPFLIIGLIAIYQRELRKNFRNVLFAVVIGVFLLIPLGLDFAKGAIFSRAAGVGLFADSGPIERINEQRGEHENFRGLESILFHNKPVNYTLAFFENWAEHYWGEFLFLSGDDIERNKVPETGQMYLIDILFVIAGLIAIAKNSKGWKPIILWLVIAPVAAALTFQSPHSLRAHNMVIPLVIISAYGLIYLSLWLHKAVRRKAFLNLIFVLFIIAITWSFTRYLHMYYVHMSKEYPFSSQYGMKELVTYI